MQTSEKANQSVLQHTRNFTLSTNAAYQPQVYRRKSHLSKIKEHLYPLVRMKLPLKGWHGKTATIMCVSCPGGRTLPSYSITRTCMCDEAVLPMWWKVRTGWPQINHREMIPGGPGQIRGGVEAFFGLGDAQRPLPGDPDLPLLPTCSRCPMSVAAPPAVLANGGTDPHSCPVPLWLCHASQPHTR